MTAINETINLCYANQNRNILVRIIVNFLAKTMKPAIECPFYGTYNYTVDRSISTSQDSAFVPPFMKNFKGGSTGTLNIVASTKVEGKKVELVRFWGFFKAVLK
jgi:hypothetical protein